MTTTQTTHQIQAQDVQVGTELFEHGTVEGIIDYGDMLFLLTSNCGRDVFPATARLYEIR